MQFIPNKSSTFATALPKRHADEDGQYCAARRNKTIIITHLSQVNEKYESVRNRFHFNSRFV